jgi:tetratricopeptide (TPR) repeat protein
MAREDRFGFDDDSGSEPSARTRQRFDPDAQGARIDEPASPTDSEAQAVQAGVRSLSKDEESSDHEASTRFDARAMKMMQAEALFGSSSDDSDEVEESELPPVSGLKSGTKQGTATVPSASLPARLRGDTGSSPSSEVRTERAERVAPDALRSESSRSVVPVQAEPPKRTAPPESSMEDDLDEADFFLQQSLFEEARAILESLLERYPAHPLVSAKLRDVTALERQAETGTSDPSAPIATDEALVDAEPPEELPGAVAADTVTGAEPAFELTRKGVIEKGVTAEDFETHYDLGIAYKEMGLIDDAIGEFKMVMGDPTREVQCHLMIGLCLLEKGQQTEAIGHFKKGLYVEGITERESLSLYFELGQAYERLGDPREALYYYEKVLKRDPRFRNIEKLVEALRSGSKVEPIAAPTPANRDELDDAFDNLLSSK